MISYAVCYRYHHVFCDNFFSSVALFLDLLKSGLYACGTLRSNRKYFPADLKQFVKSGFKERGTSETRQWDNMTVSVWQDNKPVTMIATNSDPTKQTTVNRKKKDGSHAAIPCPEIPVLYNRYMGGVDLNDQLRGYYHIRLKGRKYYKYIFWFLVDVTITNAYILCKHHTDMNIKSTKIFRADLAKALIGSYCSRKRVGRRSINPAAKRFKVEDHFPVKGAEKSRRCYYCYNHKDKKRAETTWYCQTCDKFLCHNGREGDCFLAYHQLH